MDKLQLTPSQEALQEHLDVQLRLFFSRPWTEPKFPWPLIVAKPHSGVATTIGTFPIKFLALDVLQWAIMGGRQNPTLHTLANWAGGDPCIVILKNLQSLNAITLDVAWFRAVQSELLTLLKGENSPDIEIFGPNSPFQKTFFVGTGDWTVIDGEPAFTKEDKYEDSHSRELTTSTDILCHFHSQPYILPPPTLEDWKIVLSSHFELSEPELHQIATRQVQKANSLHQLGEVFTNFLLDKPLPELNDLLNSKPTKQRKSSESEEDDLIKIRLKLLLCKIIGDASAYPLLQEEITAAVQALSNNHDITESIDTIIKQLAGESFGEIQPAAKTHFHKKLTSALALSKKLQTHQHLGN